MVVKAQSRQQTMGKTEFGKDHFKSVGLSLGSVENCKIAKLVVLVFDHISNGLRNINSFLFIVLQLADLNETPFFACGPKLLSPSGFVVKDKAVGGIDDVLRGTVILLQQNDLGSLEFLVKIQDIFHRCAAEFINTLVIIAYRRNVSVLFGNHFQQKILSTVGVLIFIHQNTTEFVLTPFQNQRILPEKIHRYGDQIVKIHGVGLMQFLLVGIEKLRTDPSFFAAPVPFFKFLRG